MASSSSLGNGGNATAARARANRLAGKDIAGVSSAAVVDARAIARMRQEATILSEADAERLKRESEQQRWASQRDAQQRKRAIMEKEGQVRARREQSALEMELEAERKAPLSSEEVARHQHLVSIRQVNSLALQAAGYMTCDALKQQQQQRGQAEQHYERIHDTIMERGRLHELKEEDEAAIVERAKRMEAQENLREQIALREKRKMHEEEAKAMEAEKILKTYEQYEQEERKRVQGHREQVQKTMQQVIETNQRIEQMKQAAKQREKQEELVAAAYLRKKALEEEAHVEEQQRARKAQEIRIAKLRAQQEKVQDKSALQDEFRAKKAWEEAEMNARRKEALDREKREQQMRIVTEDRQRQQAFHQEQQVQKQRFDAHLEENARQRNEKEIERQQEALEAVHHRNLEHGERVREQIQQNEEHRQKAKLFEHNDAKFVKKKAMKDSIVAEKYRQATLLKLQKQGVSEEYLRKLEQLSINDTNA